MTQLWINHHGISPPRPDRLRPVEHRSEIPWMKPHYGTGMWTSPLGSSYGWHHFMHYDGWIPGDDPTRATVWKLEPEPDVRIYRIGVLQDLIELVDEYPDTRRIGLNVWDKFPDWVKVAEDFDGVHLTATGQWATRLTDPNLYGWDCESILWFRWRFRQVSYWGTLRRLLLGPKLEDEINGGPRGFSRYTLGNRELWRDRRKYS